MRPSSGKLPKFLLPPKQVQVIGGAFGDGQQRQGVEKGPTALRDAGLLKVLANLGWKINDLDNVSLSHCKHEREPEENDEDVYYSESDIPCCKLIGAQCEELFKCVKKASEQRSFVLTLGGDHGLAVATIAGVIAVHPDLCVIWVDAHGDANVPETSPSKNYHGMPVAHLLGWFQKRAAGFQWLDTGGKNGGPLRLAESRLGYIALRDLDEQERERILGSDVTAFSMQHVDRRGISQVVHDVLETIDPECNRPIHLSFDIDSCDPTIAPGTGTKSRGGLTFREAHYIAEAVCETGRLVSMDLVEVNPDLDEADEMMHGDDETISPDAGSTIRLGIDIISSAMGNTIL
eukprot:GHVN01098490.1.p1 GENE.GHVN01098490.1~~GHVN01098490.1.p1  ORF type:complete len:347 (+),score=31.92 GHVN01098490.1:47-1087(+)